MTIGKNARMREDRIPYSREFADWYFELKRIYQTIFVRSYANKLGSTGGPARVRFRINGQFDFDRWASFLGVDKSILQNFEKAIKPNNHNHTISLTVVDQILTATNNAYLLNIWWPVQERETDSLYVSSFNSIDSLARRYTCGRCSLEKDASDFLLKRNGRVDSRCCIECRGKYNG